MADKYALGNSGWFLVPDNHKLARYNRTQVFIWGVDPLIGRFYDNAEHPIEAEWVHQWSQDEKHKQLGINHPKESTFLVFIYKRGDDGQPNHSSMEIVGVFDGWDRAENAVLLLANMASIFPHTKPTWDRINSYNNYRTLVAGLWFYLWEITPNTLWHFDDLRNLVSTEGLGYKQDARDRRNLDKSNPFLEHKQMQRTIDLQAERIKALEDAMKNK